MRLYNRFLFFTQTKINSARKPVKRQGIAAVQVHSVWLEKNIMNCSNRFLRLMSRLKVSRLVDDYEVIVLTAMFRCLVAKLVKDQNIAYRCDFVKSV